MRGFPRFLIVFMVVGAMALSITLFKESIGIALLSSTTDFEDFLLRNYITLTLFCVVGGALYWNKYGY